MSWSPFRPQASKREKLYTLGSLFWIAVLAAGQLYYFLKGVNFGPEPRMVSPFLAMALPCAFLYWLPLYKDRHPSNKTPSFSFLKRTVVYSSLFLVSFSLVGMTFLGVVGPFVTHSFGTPASGQYVITQKSNGYHERRSCNHFVWLRDRNSEWQSKVCLGERFWATVHVGQVVEASGNRSALGRTIEHLSPRAD